jgi:hypothetical protein
MKVKSVLSNILNWLQSTEMFARPSKKLPGKWILREYYTEPGNELIHMEEAQLKAQQLFWEAEFTKDEKFLHHTNIAVPLLSGISNGTWDRSKNFITIIHPEDFRKNVEFQFAIDKEDLKLLKKDAFGKIEFFGFFRKANQVKV